MKRRWLTTEKNRVYENPFLSVRRDRKRREPDDGKMHDFFVIETVDWCNIVPLTDDDEIVFIELHRHGIDEVTLEIPGGMIDPDDPSPLAAASREMREETGYVSDDIVQLGVVHPNPALQLNRCYSFLARGVTVDGAPRPDETEDIDVVLYPRRDVPRLLREGKISHALVVACMLWLDQHDRFL